MGGRAAEELCIGRISTGAMNDLEKVTKRAYGMVAYAGMSESLPNLCYYNNDEYSFSKPYSEHTAELIDKEVKQLIAEQYARAKQILDQHKDGHAQLAQLLIEREVIYAEDVERIFGKRPWISRTEEILAANAEENGKSDDLMDHNAENEEFIRKKIVDAVLEKAKNGTQATPQKPKTDQPAPAEEGEAKDPKPFQELKVTNIEAIATETIEATATAETATETVGTDTTAETTDTTNPAETAETNDTNNGTLDDMEPFELLDDLNLPAQAAKPKRKKQSKSKPIAPTTEENTLFGW